MFKISLYIPSTGIFKNIDIGQNDTVESLKRKSMIDDSKNTKYEVYFHGKCLDDDMVLSSEPGIDGNDLYIIPNTYYTDIIEDVKQSEHIDELVQHLNNSVSRKSKLCDMMNTKKYRDIFLKMAKNDQILIRLLKSPRTLFRMDSEEFKRYATTYPRMITIALEMWNIIQNKDSEFTPYKDLARYSVDYQHARTRPNQANRANNQAGASRHAANASQPSTNSNQPNITQELFTRLMQDVMNSGSTNPAVPTPAPAANNVGPAASTSVTPPVTISPEQLASKLEQMRQYGITNEADARAALNMYQGDVENALAYLFDNME